MEKKKKKEQESKPKGMKGKGLTNKTSYPAYQKVMLRVTTKFVVRMKEEKEPTLYKTYISLVINHLGAVDMSVRDTTMDDVWQMIRDRSACTSLGKITKNQKGKTSSGHKMSRKCLSLKR